MIRSSLSACCESPSASPSSTFVTRVPNRPARSSMVLIIPTRKLPSGPTSRSFIRLGIKPDGVELRDGFPKAADELVPLSRDRD